MRTKHILILAFASLVTLTSSVSPDTTNEIIQSISIAFQKGDSPEIAKHCTQTIEMKLFEDENMFSKAQVEILLKDFFSKNRPISFKTNHQGAKGNTSFAIGTLLTSQGGYRVSIFLKMDNGKMRVHQLRIELSE